MCKAVRVLAEQQMPNYRKPASFLIKETYPLPPYSTLIGLTHELCGWTGKNKGYRPMRVSVQGSSASVVSDYATNYAFGAIPLDRAALKVDNGDGKQSGIARMPRNYELLTDVTLLLHIIPEDRTLIDDLYKAFLDPPVYPSLGRYEDLLRIDSVEIVELGEAPEELSTKYDAYIPVETLEGSPNVFGTLYKLGKVFEYDTGKGRQEQPSKKARRVWKQSVMVRHVCPGTAIDGSNGVLYDEKHDEAVFLA